MKTYDSRTSHPPRLTPRTFVLPQLKSTALLLFVLFNVSKSFDSLSEGATYLDGAPLTRVTAAAKKAGKVVRSRILGRGCWCSR